MLAGKELMHQQNNVHQLHVQEFNYLQIWEQASDILPMVEESVFCLKL